MNSTFDEDLIKLAVAIDTVVDESDRKDTQIAELGKRIADLEQAMADVQAVLLCRMDAGLQVRSALVLVDTALQPKPATNAHVRHVTPSGESDWPQIAPEAV
jgi:hypothetical protein